MFYLNRGGAPEGPYEEGRIANMIRSGELSQAGVCPVGQNQWWALQQVPAFAQALAERAAAAAPVAPPAAYGAPPAAHGAHLHGHGALHAAASPPKKGARGLLLLALGALVFVFAVGSALGAYLMFFAAGGAPALAASMPRDSEVFIEVGSLPGLIADFKTVEYLDTSLRDDKKVLDDTADSLSKAFDISLGDAQALLVSARSVGFAARRLTTSAEGAFAVGFASAAPVDAWLASKRFIASGALGQTGRRYQMTKKVLSSSVGQDLRLKGLADAELGTGKEALLWLPQQRLLAFGSEAFVTDLAKVVEEKAASVETNPSYQAALKDFDPRARVTAFVDPLVLSNIDEPKLKALVDGYFKPAGPLTSSLTVSAAGFVTSLTGRVIGSKLPRSSSLSAPVELGLPSRLQNETFAYVAFQTDSKLSGAEVQKLLVEQLEAVEPRSRREVEQGVQQLEQLLGVSVAKLVDGLGGEAVLSVAAPAELAFDGAALAAGAEAALRLNVTWIQQLDDDAEFQRLAAQLKQKLLPSLREARFTEDGPGFSLTPLRAALPVSLRVKFFDKHLFITAGEDSLCDRAEGAFSKADRTLKDDGAHQAALGALPAEQHLRFWLDTGRVSDALFKNPLLRARATENGMQLEKFRLTGPARVTTAFSVRSEVQNEVWTYRIDALNAQALAPLALGAAAFGGLGGSSGLGARPTLPPL
jgi:hypothetical protein